MGGQEVNRTRREECMDQGDKFEYEAVAREASYNQTAVESCFGLVVD
jgi:hypothetical protein